MRSNNVIHSENKSCWPDIVQLPKTSVLRGADAFQLSGHMLNEEWHYQAFVMNEAIENRELKC